VENVIKLMSWKVAELTVDGKVVKLISTTDLTLKKYMKRLMASIVEEKRNVFRPFSKIFG
jgi:hypothetical protein